MTRTTCWTARVRLGPFAHVAATFALLTVLSCGKSTSPVTPTPTPSTPTARAFNHVFIVVEENQGYDQIIGNPAMPYFNGLANTYGLATQYHANSHPSIGNYFMLTVGEVVTEDDNYSGLVRANSIVSELGAAGKTWKSYAEDLPSVGYTGFDTGGYVRRHNVFALLADVAENPAQARNLVPFTQFAADLASNTLPNYAFIVPNLCNDAHSCPVGVADAWLQTNISPLLNSRQFQTDGLLIITFDESEDNTAGGGGRVAWVAVSSRSKRAYRSATFYQHQSTLRLTAEALGLAAFPGRAATAPSMNEFFD